jgi:hypothetical protein
MKIATSELAGAALDWAVATAQGRENIRVFAATRPTDRGWIEVRFNPDPRAATARFDPSEDWSQAGPIIEREYIEVKPTAGVEGQLWSAQRMAGFCAQGPTPLAAAMRCFVASKLGDAVDVPDELLTLRAPAPQPAARRPRI